MHVRLAFVLDERCGNRTTGENVVGRGPIHPGPLGEDKRLGDGLVQRVHYGVHHELHRRPSTLATDVHDPVTERAEDTASPLQYGRVAADEDGELAALH